ncbi:MAG TPA: Sir2 family NAD-dependent protein deacetylase [Kofleriaceae bacterium]|nr:Sir2 family NAD-dependent protein deacetylase [Kofleriaceae bacterium]
MDATEACRTALGRAGGVVVLTGAGISAESGIPTFRGKEGYWTVGSRDYHPQELATHDAFERMPWEVWAWYLYRRAVCRAAAPNPAHAALVRLEAALGDRFALVTQNVDGLHPRAGSRRVHAIHGDIDQMRCAAECSPERTAIPDDVTLAKGEPVSEAVRARLRCPRCGGMARPHVLWFDESYDEPRYHLDTVRALAARAALLVVVGTSAQTNLPWQVVTLAGRAGATIVDCNIEDNPFGELAGHALRAPAAVALPPLLDALIS